jgi:hypothetical protein
MYTVVTVDENEPLPLAVRVTGKFKLHLDTVPPPTRIYESKVHLLVLQKLAQSKGEGGVIHVHIARLRGSVEI